MKYLTIIAFIVILGGCTSTNVYDPLRSPCACKDDKKTNKVS